MKILSPRSLLPGAALAILFLAQPLHAEEMAMKHKAMAMDDPFAASREVMHQAMQVTPTGNVDVDFVANMIPHHEGAVAMAKVVLEKGKDPELKKLAEDIITAQEKEISFMKEWQKKAH